LLIPDNHSGEKVVECLASWSRSGLVEPFVWCRAESEVSPAGDTLVSRVDAGATREMLLGAALQGGGHSEHELIAFYPATPGEGFDPGLADAAIAYVDLLARTIAHDPTRPARCTMVVAPSQIGQPIPRGLLRQGFVANVYVAPEDRAEPRDPNRLLGNEEVFPMHAAHAIATVGDLWNESPSERPPVVEVLVKRQPHNQLAVQVIRCFSRGIDFGYLPDHVSAGIFYGEGGWPNPDQHRLDRIDDPERIVPHVVNDYVTTFRREIGLSEFEPRRLEDPEPLGLLEAFLLLVRLIVMRIRRKPFEVVRQRLDSIHDAAADWVERQAGPDSGIQVKHRGGRQGQGEEELELKEVLDRPLIVPDGPVAEAWTALRYLVLGLVDGSELPDGIDLARLVNGRGQRALITDPGALAPHPDSDPPPGIENEGPICDPLRLDPSLAPRDSPEEEPNEALGEWIQERRAALLWRVGVWIGTALQTARSESGEDASLDPGEDDEPAEQGEAPGVGEQKRTLRKRLRRTLFLSSLLALVGVVVAVGQLSLIGITVSVVAIVAGWFLALASAARRWLIGDDAISRSENERELAVLNAAMRRSLRRGDAIRLERRYREYLDWAEVIARLVHSPWVGDPLDRVTLVPPIDHGTLPAAFSVGVAEITELGLERLSAAAGSGVFGKGWLAGVYETTERLEMTEMGIRRGLSAEDAEVDRDDPTTDVGEDREGPRRRMLEAIRRGKHRSLTGSEFGDGVLEYLSDLGPERVCERVAVLPTADGATLGEEIDALPPPLAGFQPPEALSRLVAELSPAVVGIECEARNRDFGGTGVVVEVGLVATAREVVEGAISIVVVGSGGERLETELRRIDPETGLALLAVAGGEEIPAAPFLDPPAVAPGDAVISIGRPLSSQREPAVFWGLATASQRRRNAPGAPAVPVFPVAYHRAEGAVGAPVFSLEGELLGIHCSAPPEQFGDVRAQRMSSVVPVSEVRKLMRAGDESEVADRLVEVRAFTQEAVAPSAFIEELTHVDPPPALLTHHWKDAQRKNETKETIPSRQEAASGSDAFSSLAGDLAFRVPLRVIVHRVDLVPPTSVRDLASFVEIDMEEEEPDEKVGTETM
jgi:hypothetical protein